jgi:CRP/FNR family transcriptional regulator, dissimilatory nitrate respiration regulator
MVDDALLDQVKFLRGLNEDARRILAAGSAVRHCAPGALLWRAGDHPRGLWILLEGEVRVVRDTNGRQRVIHTEGPGGTLGEIPLFEGTTYPATAIAARRSAFLVFERDTIIAAMGADPRLAVALMARLAGRVRHLIERLERNQVRSVPARLAGYVKERVDSASGDTFTLGATQQAVAEELGTVREVIVRALRRMRHSGVISPAGRGRYRVLDHAALHRLADGQENG